MKKYIIILIALIFTCLNSNAQELQIANQYLLNKFLYNPAFVGNYKEAYELKLTDRHQWVGIEDAPFTQSLSFQGRFGKSNGLGICLYNDNNGANFSRGLQLAYAYMIKFDNLTFLIKRGDLSKPVLSFGISANISRFSLDQREFLNYNNDPVFTGTVENAFIPNSNAGIYFYSPIFYAGISAFQLLPVKVKMYNQQFEPSNSSAYYFNIGFKIGETYSNPNWLFEPSILFKLNFKQERQIDLNLKIKYYRMFWVGTSFRRNMDKNNGSNLSNLLLMGIDFKNIRFAYVYDISFNKLRNLSNGSHEIMIGYVFSRNINSSKY